MYNKIHIGQNAAEVLKAPAFKPISKVAVLVDDKNEYVSGDDTGRTLEITCPYGSQAMADNLLTQLKGYVYQPMTAQDALLDPAAEIGDGVTVGGVYTILAQIDTMFDMHCAADIAAPGEEELETEYVYQTPGKRLERQLAQTRSLISKTAEEVKLSVKELDGKYTALSVTLDGVTITDPDGTTKIKGSSIETSSLYVDAAHITGKLTASQVEIDLSGSIKWTDLSTDVQNEINDAYAMAEDAEAAAADAADTVDGWRYNGGTYIDSSKIMVTTLMATELLGGEVALLTAAERQAGGIEITGSSSSSYAIELWSNGALRLTANSGAVYIEDASGAHLALADDAATIQGSSAYFEASDQAWVQGHLLPVYKEAYYCGNANFPWLRMYTTTLYVDGEQVTSDRNKKHDIVYDLSGYDAFFDGLKAAIFKLDNDLEERNNLGLIAQDVEELAAMFGMTEKECGLVVREIGEDGKVHYYLRYLGFIGLLIDQVQKLKARVAELEE